MSQLVQGNYILINFGAYEIFILIFDCPVVRTLVVYMLSKIPQLTLGSRDLSQAEKENYNCFHSK